MLDAARVIRDAEAAAAAGNVRDALALLTRAMTASIAPPAAAALLHARALLQVTRLQDVQRGVADWEAAAELDPANEAYRVNLLTLYKDNLLRYIGRIAEVALPLLASERPEIARVAHEALIFAKQCQPVPTAEAYRGLVQDWSRRFIEPFLAPRKDLGGGFGKSLRIGFLHRFFDASPYVPLIAPLVEELARRGHHVIAVSSALNDEYVPTRLRQAVARWLNVSRLSDPDAARLLEQEDLDVMVNLDGFSSATRFGLLARRPARLMASWHNTHYTFGGELFDCILADRTVITPEEAVDYSETLVHLPHCYFAVEPLVDAPQVSPLPAETRGHLTFGSFNRPDKIGPETARCWARLLDGMPGSRLHLRNVAYSTPALRGATLAALEQVGIGRERVTIEGGAETYQFLDSYANVDLALDTFPFNGGFTTYQALWQGVPVPAFPGRRWASRVSVSILKAAGLHELIARDQDAYETLVLRLATAPHKLARLRRTLRARLRKSHFTNLRAFAGDFADALVSAFAARKGGGRST